MSAIVPVRLLLGLALLGLSGCALTRTPLRGADPGTLRDLPGRFVVGSHTGTATTAPRAGEGCHSPLVDPRDGTRLLLVESAGGVGLYEAPAGRYGQASETYLRIACATGQVVLR